jgi:hypothetical protein
MCNAWNHSPECTCGWGGNGHLGRRDSGSGPNIDTRYSWVPPITQTRNSYTIPNAACPVCGAAVYFYQSSNGGRVFFDELGPPWPKHPCTDSTSVPKAILIIDKHTYHPKWQATGWEPFFIAEILKLYKFALGIKGTLAGESITLYVKKDSHPEIGKVSKLSIAFLRGRGDGSFELSLLTTSGTLITTIAYRNPVGLGGMIVSKIGRTQKGKRKELVDSSRNNKKANREPHSTSIALALSEALKKK